MEQTSNLPDLNDRLMTNSYVSINAYERKTFRYGSYASGRVTEDSDIDLAILPRSPMTHEEVWIIAQKLSIRLGSDVDLINLMDCNTVLSMQVVEEGKLLFDPNHKALF